MVNSTSTPVPHLVTSYLNLEKAVLAELNLKISTATDRSDFLEARVHLIKEAIQRLAQAIILKCQLKKEDYTLVECVYFEKLDPVEVAATSLSTYDDMLDAQFSVDINSHAE